jgi:hypothetical protein
MSASTSAASPGALANEEHVSLLCCTMDTQSMLLLQLRVMLSPASTIRSRLQHYGTRRACLQATMDTAEQPSQHSAAVHHGQAGYIRAGSGAAPGTHRVGRCTGQASTPAGTGVKQRAPKRKDVHLRCICGHASVGFPASKVPPGSSPGALGTEAHVYPSEAVGYGQ